MSKQRAKGTKFETAIIPWLKVIWPNVVRTGSRDYGAGDYENTEDIIIEAKCRKDLRLAEWMKQVHNAVDRNRDKGARYGIVVHKRKFFGPQGAYVTVALEDFISILAKYRDIELPEDLYPVSDEDTDVPDWDEDE